MGKLADIRLTLFRPGVKRLVFIKDTGQVPEITGGSLSRIANQRMFAVTALAVLLASAGCDRLNRRHPLGKLSVRVVDANGTPVRGAAADLYRLTPTGKVYWRASSTDSLGIAVFGASNGGVVQGDYLIHVSFISWRYLAPGEANDRSVTVKKGTDTVITFRTVPRHP